MDKIKTFLAENVDKKVVFSAMIAAALIGGAVYFGSRSGFAPLVKASEVVKGGK